MNRIAWGSSPRAMPDLKCSSNAEVELLRAVIIILVFFSLTASCSDTIQETIYDKDLEAGRFDHSRFDNAKFK